MTYARTALASIVTALILSVALTVACATVAHARPVSLKYARSAPSELTMLYPGAHVTYADAHGYNCQRTTRDGSVTRRGYFTNVSAYNWRGDALGAQRWVADHTVIRWYVPARPRQWVAFDGVTFTNHTRSPVLVAGWCD